MEKREPPFKEGPCKPPVVPKVYGLPERLAVVAGPLLLEVL